MFLGRLMFVVIWLIRSSFISTVSVRSCSMWKRKATTVAGSDDGAGSGNDQFNQPIGLFIDKTTDDRYIVDARNYRIQKYTPGSRTGITVLGDGQGHSLSQLIWPRSIRIDRNKNIYVADAFRVLKFPPNPREGIIVAGRGLNGSGLNEMTSGFDVYIDVYDNLYVSDYHNHHVLKFKPNQTQGILIAGITNQPRNGSKQLSGPRGIYAYKNGDLLVSDSGNHRIQKFTMGKTGGVTIAGTGQCGTRSIDFCGPEFVSVDDEDNIYVTDGYNHRVQRWKKGAKVGETIAGGNGRGNGSDQLNLPSGFAFDSKGNLYIVDYSNSRLQKFLHNTTQCGVSGSQAKNDNRDVHGTSDEEPELENTNVVSDSTCFSPSNFNEYMNAMKKEAETIKQHAETIKEQIVTANAFRSSIEKLTTVLQQQKDRSKYLP